MDRISLEAMSIIDLRALAEKSGIKTRKKVAMIAALADDYRQNGAHQAVAVEVVPPPTAWTPPQEPQRPQQPQEPTAQSVWPDVPKATSDINGDYVLPPWYGELEAAASIGHVELMGPAGSGKTLAVHHLATKLGKRLAVVTADGGLRKRDLVGQREMINSTTILQVAEFASAARDGHWALIDEANMAEADALGFLNGMLDRAGTVGSTFVVGGQAIEVHPDFRCFMTRNPGYQGTKLMNEALRDRFWSIEVPPLMGDGLSAMFVAHKVKKEFIKDATFMVETLYGNWERNRITYQISPRRALSAARMAAITKEGFREVLTRSILNKIDSKHERESVAEIIQASWRARDLAMAHESRENSNPAPKTRKRRTTRKSSRDGTIAI